MKNIKFKDIRSDISSLKKLSKAEKLIKNCNIKIKFAERLSSTTRG